ncbi:MAG TPA: hypothetical protein VGG74_34520 [Kofleriaceae bacterium]|jgi:hypothetical protein
MKAAIVAVTLVGCSYAKPVVAPAAVASATSPTVHAPVGCIDIAMTRVARAPKPVVSYALTNTCDREASVDSSAYELQTVAVEPDGEWTKLFPVQRQHQAWQGYRLDPHETKVVEREFRGGGLPADAKICTDLGGADPRIDYAPRWACVTY